MTREVTEQSRRELTRMHERQQAMIGDLEASVRILGVSMEAASANIAEMLGALDSLRAHSAESLGDVTAPTNVPPRHAEAAGDGGAGDQAARDEGTGDDPDSVAVGADDPAGGDDTDDTEDAEDADDADDADDHDVEPAPARTARSGHLVDALADLDGLGADDDEDPPLTATEAFLRSAHIDHGDPPLPPADDADVGARYARDAMRATARARTRRDEETLEVLPEREAEHGPGHNGRSSPDERSSTDDQDDADGDDADASGKPLGWLFRSSS